MIVMTTSSTSLEEQVAFFAKSVESLTSSMKAKDEQIAFLMKKITTLTGEKLAISNQDQHVSL